MFKILENKGFIVYDKLTFDEQFYGKREAATSDGIGLEFKCEDDDSEYAYNPDSDYNYLIYRFNITDSYYTDDVEGDHKSTLSVWYKDFRRIVRFIKVGDEFINLYSYSLYELVKHLDGREGTIELVFNNKVFNSLNIVDFLASKSGLNCYTLEYKTKAKRKSKSNPNPIPSKTIYIPVIDNYMLMNDEGIVCFEDETDEINYMDKLITSGKYLGYADEYGLGCFVSLLHTMKYSDVINSGDPVVLGVPVSGAGNTLLKNLNELDTLLPKPLTSPNPEDDVELIDVVNLTPTFITKYDITYLSAHDTVTKYDDEKYMDFIETLNS